MSRKTLSQTRPGSMIGAWGFRYFENDHDYNIVGHLGAEMGLLPDNMALPKGYDPRRNDSLLNPKNRTFIANHFREPRHYNKVFHSYMQQLQNYKVIDVTATREADIMIDSPRYYLFILGLLGMQLGCPLLRKHRRWMKANYQTCLPMYERYEQAKKAVFEYENGKPLNLGSKTLREQMLALRDMEDDEDPNVPNIAIELAIIRMHMDNAAAQAKGGSATEGVNISTAFNSEIDFSVVEKAAADNAGKAAYCNTPEASEPATPLGAKFSSWSANDAGEARLATHASASVVHHEKLDNKSMVEILAKMKNHTNKDLSIALDTVGLASCINAQVGVNGNGVLAS